MKTHCLLLLIASTALALPFEEPTSSTAGWHVPQADGTFVWMTEAEFQQEAESAINSRKAANVKYYLYTNANSNSPQQIDPTNAATLSYSNFNKNNPTRIIIHGWQNNYQSAVNSILRSALLDTGSYNVICVDWSSKAETLIYSAAAGSVDEVGQQVASFIDFLNQQGGMSFDKLIVIGHSLGAHVSGFAGKNVRNGRISQITGLDPAYPGFVFSKKSSRLSDTDANFVESIQTCGGMLGFLEPIGKAAFYPNGGKSQPGCGMDLDGACAHGRSYEYYGEAIRRNNFPSIQCGNYKDAVNKKCGNSYSSIRMGAASNVYGANGVYYVPVNSKSPFGMG